MTQSFVSLFVQVSRVSIFDAKYPCSIQVKSAPDFISKFLRFRKMESESSDCSREVYKEEVALPDQMPPLEVLVRENLF